MTSPSILASFSRLGDAGQDFFLWWKSTMLGMVPSKMRSRTKPGNKALKLLITKTGYSLDGADEQPLSSLGETLAALHSGNRAADLSLDLILDETRYLSRRISSMRLPASVLKRAAELDVLTDTPFEMGDIKLLFPADQSRGATYWIVRRDILDEIAAQLRLSKIHVAEVHMGTGQATAAPRLNPSNVLPMRTRKLSRSLEYCLMVLTCIAGIFCIYQFEKKISAAHRYLDGQIEEVEKSAHAARSNFDQYAKRMQQLQSLNTRHAATRMVTQSWEELSEIIPDSAFLTDFSNRNGQMALTGFAKNPAELIGKIEASPLFAQARFTSPVVRIPGFDGDQFHISFETENKQ